MSVYFSIKYGYEPMTSDTQMSEWWEHEDYRAVCSTKVKQHFEELRNVGLTKNGVRANNLYLLLMGDNGLILNTINHHRYDGHEPIQVMATLEDRPHKEIGKARAIIPVPEGVWIVIEKSSETGEVGIIGAARTPAGAKKLMEMALPVMDDTRTLRVEYRSFIEGTPNA